MYEWFNGLSGRLIDLLIYGAIAVCFVLGLSKCVLPLRKTARLFRRGIHSLSLFKPNDAGRPDWQDANFLGKPLQKQWQRFLQNAEQLDQRGLSCDVEDYINDHTVLTEQARFQLAEVIPGLLTSLGILGTFVGLMRGLGGLDLSNAEKTVGSIHTMIGGMTFAYGTSIAGLTCSLLFNILFRSSQGSATAAMDDFNETFAAAVMARPLDDQVRQTCYMEDQAAFLSTSINDINLKLESGIDNAVQRSFAPISQGMHQFIMNETQAQVEGLNHVVNQFVNQMNSALGGQFLQLGKTLSMINQSQAVSLESVNQTMEAADTIMDGIRKTNLATQTMMERFDHYVKSLSKAQEGSAELGQQTVAALAAMQQQANQAKERFDALRDAQAQMSREMEEYAAWSGRVLEAVEKQSDGARDQAHEIANEMNRSGKLLKDSYTDFVANISQGLARTMGLFEENMRDMTKKMTEDLGKTLSKDTGSGLDLKQFGRVQQALNDMTEAVNRAARAANHLAEGA